MEWAQIDIYTTTEGIDPVTLRLMDLGISGFVIRDSKDFEDFLENKNGNWDYVDEDLMGLKDCETCITVYLTKDSEGANTLTSIKSELAALKAQDLSNSLGRLEIESASIHDEDWANNWKKYFKPIKIGERLLIKPSWEQAAENESRKILQIDPASSFGTGQHDTTSLCLELIEQKTNKGDKVLDIGCGSGILSIGALLLGAKTATAVDIEPNSVKTAAENALDNGFGEDRYLTYCGNVATDAKLREEIGKDFDMVCANIVADVLISMSQVFGEFLKSGGRLVISGIIDERLNETLDAVKQGGFELIETKSRGGWNAAFFTKA
ncbi:MAG: 50S ribosomal protein L11 methyltransferase [Ruminococcus sp.]|nr:50S ribosomal protein L11 methyltransferase [Ruminococcus sp.]